MPGARPIPGKASTTTAVLLRNNSVWPRCGGSVAFADLIRFPGRRMGPVTPGVQVRCARAAEQTIPFFSSEIIMPKISLSAMIVEALMDLRKRVDEMLVEHRAKLIGQLERIAVVGGARLVRGGTSVLKGRKVQPKYRAPSGETWAGRGAKPRWLVAAIKGGKKLEDFLIDKSARKGRRKRGSKR